MTVPTLVPTALDRGRGRLRIPEIRHAFEHPLVVPALAAPARVPGPGERLRRSRAAVRRSALTGLGGTPIAGAEVLLDTADGELETRSNRAGDYALGVDQDTFEALPSHAFVGVRASGFAPLAIEIHKPPLRLDSVKAALWSPLHSIKARMSTSESGSYVMKALEPVLEYFDPTTNSLRILPTLVGVVIDGLFFEGRSKAEVRDRARPS